MNTWIKYTKNAPKVELSDLTSEKIVMKIGSCLDDFLRCDTTDGQRTERIKAALTELGRTLNYKVEANRLPAHMRQSHGGQEKNTEWLYDIHWYEEVEDDDYMPTSLPLVVECEWNPKRNGERKQVPYSGIKYDFQKLLIANADLRLMIFRIRKRDKEEDLQELSNYFDKAINSYRNLAGNSKFLFIAFDEGGKQIRYTEKFKRQAKSNF